MVQACYEERREKSIYNVVGFRDSLRTFSIKISAYRGLPSG